MIFLSPEGSLLRRLPKGSNCFYFTFYWCRKRYPGFKILLGLSHFFFAKMFYPPKGVCFADSHRGPIVFTLHFIGVGRGTQDSKSYWVYRTFFSSKCFIWWDGMGWDGVGRKPKVSFNFFHFKIII